MTRTLGETSRYVSKLLHIFGYLILAIGVGTVLSAAYLMRAGYSVVPYWDELDEMTSYLDATHKSVLTWMWAQHNEHRLLFYKALFVVDMRFFQGRNWPMYVAIFCSQVALAVVFGYMLHQLGDCKGPLWQACFGLTLYCLFCPSQWENFSWAFQFSFVLVNVWVVMAVLFLVIQKQHLVAEQPSGMKALLVSLLAATAASFTNGNGITVWPVLITVALLAKLPWRLVGAYFLGLACVVPLYLIGYHSPSQHASPFESGHQPRLILEYMEKYLGGGAVPDSHIDLARLIGLLGLIAAVALVPRLIMHRGNRSLLEYCLAGIVLYSVATALITSLGRVNFGTNQAFTSRYQTFALLFWLALSLWIISIVAREPSANWLVAVYLLIVVTLCYSATHYGRILERVRHNTAKRELAGVSLITGVHDKDFLQFAILPSPIALPEIEELRARRLSLFSTPRAVQFGQNFAQFYRAVSPSECEGNVEATSYVNANPEDVGIRGWVIDRRTGGPVEEVVFVAEGKIAGFGVLGPGRVDVANALHSKRAIDSGWIGYAKLTESRTLDFYGILNSSGRKYGCHFGAIPIGSSYR